MTRAQEHAMRRFTLHTWALLGYVAGMHPLRTEIAYPWMETADILKRKGFLSISTYAPNGCPRGCGSWVKLTDAGQEAWDRAEPHRRRNEKI
jgi:hypothetical protein